MGLLDAWQTSHLRYHRTRWQKLAGAGEVRDGGSFEARMGGVACWNATMDENRYMVRKWNEFVAA